MDQQNDVNKLNHEAGLRRQELHWQAQIDDIRHSDRAAVDLGITTLKTAILINAGALVAILALLGQLWHDQGRLIVPVLSNTRLFVGGLICAALGSVAAYFYQSLVTLRRHMELRQMSTGRQPARFKAAIRWLRGFQVTMVLLVLVSYALFVYGVRGMVIVLHP